MGSDRSLNKALNQSLNLEARNTATVPPLRLQEVARALWEYGKHQLRSYLFSSSMGMLVTSEETACRDLARRSESEYQGSPEVGGNNH
jgi:hypothetical protein